MLFLEGVIKQENGKTKFSRVKAPSHSDMERLVNTISHRIAQYLEKTGLIQRDTENTYLELPMDDEDSLLPLHGVFAPNANVRAEVTASQRGKNSPRLVERLKDSDKPYHARSMSWAQRLKRVFNINITVCEACKKTNVKIIACITEPAVIQKILTHLDKQGSPITANSSRASPLNESVQPTLLDDFVIQRDFDFGA
ncbi:transposase [Glaciecola sp. KUL10]|uniref:transposase n=1 Tax=Glaciecola sp. (strain KUL10) TaxID=2161813 RepID=UPI000D83DB81|nr:transposase [Glaciecola sp. KUL10]GBL05517.1 transposase [Glaciecola sp. KUL10]